MKKLFFIQDSANPAYVLAESWEEALAKWRAYIVAECDGDDDESPQGINMVADGAYDTILT